MHLIRITDLPPFDGEYPIDLSSFNGRELHEIKKLSGVRGNELGEALLAGDYDLLIAFAVIALERNGRKVPAEALFEAEIGRIVLDEDPATVPEGDARPPDSSPTLNGTLSLSGDEISAKPSSETSGSDSSTNGDPSPNAPTRTGSPGSESSESQPETDLEAAPI